MNDDLMESNEKKFQNQKEKKHHLNWENFV